MSLSDYEYARSRRERRGRPGWSGRIEYRVPDGNWSDALIPSIGSAFPDGEHSGDSPVLDGYDLDRDPVDFPGTTLLVCTYTDPTFDRWMEMNASVGVLLGDSAVESQRFWKIGGTIMEGQVPSDDEGKVFRKITSGSRVRYVPRHVFHVHAVVNDLDIWYHQFTDRVGCVSSTYMTHFGSSFNEAGKLLLAKVGFRPRPAAGRLWTADYYFWGNPDGWETTCTSTEFEVKLIRQPVYTYDESTGLTDSGETRVLQLEVPNGNTVTKTVIQSANFSPINNDLLGGGLW